MFLGCPIWLLQILCSDWIALVWWALGPYLEEEYLEDISDNSAEAVALAIPFRVEVDLERPEIHCVGLS